MTPGGMEALREEVVSLVDAADRCGVSHCGIESLVRSEYLRRAEALPKVPVVYNSNYGGHDLSTTFQAFIATYDDSHEPYYKVLGFGQFLCENGFGEKDCTGRAHWARGLRTPADISDDEITVEERTQLDGLLQLIASRTVKPLPNKRNALWEKVGLHFAAGCCAELDVKWVPNGVSYRLEDYDGKETVVW